MIGREPRRKFNSPIDLIILSCLAFLGLSFINQQIQERSCLRALEVTYWSPRDTFYPSPKSFVNENFNRITLTGSKYDEDKLRFVQSAIRKLIHQSDRTRGIEITLTDQVKYSSLVKLFDLCNQEEVPSYAHYKNKFWVFNLHPRKPSRRKQLTINN